MKINKYLYGYKFFVNYGQGWEYECFELTYKEMRSQVKEYQRNCRYPLKVTLGRELNPDYPGNTSISNTPERGEQTT